MGTSTSAARLILAASNFVATTGSSLMQLPVAPSHWASLGLAEKLEAHELLELSSLWPG